VRQDRRRGPSADLEVRPLDPGRRELLVDHELGDGIGREAVRLRPVGGEVTGVDQGRSLLVGRERGDLVDPPSYGVADPLVAAAEVDLHPAPLPRDRPRYVMGVGMPDELAEYVARGVDMMDCVLPSRNARNGCLFTSEGRVIIKQNQYKDDPRPLDESCNCYTCRTFSRAYLRHLFQAGEMTFSTLATLHNLRRYLDIMREIRQAILIGKFPEYLKARRATSAPAIPECNI